MKKIKPSFIAGIISKVENTEFNFWFYFLSILSIITIRIVLENMVIYKAPILSLSQFVHYFLFSFSLFLSFLLVFNWFTKNPLKMDFKIVSLFFFIILIVPVADYIFYVNPVSLSYFSLDIIRYPTILAKSDLLICYDN